MHPQAHATETAGNVSCSSYRSAGSFLTCGRNATIEVNLLVEARGDSPPLGPSLARPVHENESQIIGANEALR